MRRQMYKRPLKEGEEPKGQKFTVQEQDTLLPFLIKTLKGQSRTTIKSILGRGQIWVNNKITTQFNTPLNVNDTVLISDRKGRIQFNNPLINIIWEDEYLMVVNKKEGLLSVSTNREHERTAFNILSNYLKKKDSRSKLFVLHRLDKETSGLMMFAKNKGIQEDMQSQWNDVITQRSYVAVVEGQPEKPEDTIISFLKENKQMQVFTTDKESGKEAISHYKTLKAKGSYALLEIALETGRKNHIRAQMQSIGHPIAGDPKYGAETNPTGRLMLHARRLHFIHPISKEEMKFDTQIPDSFSSLVK